MVRIFAGHIMYKGKPARLEDEFTLQGTKLEDVTSVIRNPLTKSASNSSPANYRQRPKVLACQGEGEFTKKFSDDLGELEIGTSNQYSSADINYQENGLIHPFTSLDTGGAVSKNNTLSNFTFHDAPSVPHINYNPNHPQIQKFFNKYGRNYLR